MLRQALACTVTLLSSCWISAALAQQPARVQGTVRRAGGAEVIVGAEIRARGLDLRALSDSGGSFTVVVPTGAPIVLEVRAVGYQPKEVRIQPRAGSEQRVEVTLAAAPTTLPEVTVRSRWAKPERLAYTDKYDEFYRRRDQGLGSFLTREDIDRASAVRTFELLRGLPGIRVRWNPPGVPGTEVRFARCAEFPPKISVWIDGQRQPFTPRGVANNVGGIPQARLSGAEPESQATRSEVWRSWLELLDRVTPRDVEAMEVFRGPGQIPTEFADDSCAAVVIWTRDGGKSSD